MSAQPVDFRLEITIGLIFRLMILACGAVTSNLTSKNNKVVGKYLALLIDEQQLTLSILK